MGGGKYEQCVRAQLARIQSFCDAAEKAPTVGQGPLVSGLEFARELIVCPTEDAAKRLLQRHQGNTQSFVQLASALLSDLPPGVAASDPQNDGKTTPFYHLCDMVIDAMEATDQLVPDEDLPD